MAAERKFSSEALREIRATGASLKEMAGHFGVAPSTISRRLAEIDAENFAQGEDDEAEIDDRTTPPLPGMPAPGAQYDVYGGVLKNLKRAEDLLRKDLSHQERVRVMAQVRQNLLTLHELQSSAVREDAAEILKGDVLAAMAEMDDETRAKFESVLRRRRDLRRPPAGH